MVRCSAPHFAALLRTHAAHHLTLLPPHSPQAWLHFEAQGDASGPLAVKIANSNAFTSTDGLAFEWRVVLNGAPLVLGKAGADGWREVSVSPIAAQVRLVCVCFCVLLRRTASAAPLLRRTHLRHPPQASSIVSLGVSGADVRSAAQSVLASMITARPSELFLEVRAAMRQATAWCDAVSIAECVGVACGETRCMARRCAPFLWGSARRPPPPPHPPGPRRCRRPGPPSRGRAAGRCPGRARGGRGPAGGRGKIGRGHGDGRRRADGRGKQEREGGTPASRAPASRTPPRPLSNAPPRLSSSLTHTPPRSLHRSRPPPAPSRAGPCAAPTCSTRPCCPSFSAPPPTTTAGGRAATPTPTGESRFDIEKMGKPGRRGQGLCVLTSSPNPHPPSSAGKRPVSTAWRCRPTPSS